MSISLSSGPITIRYRGLLNTLLSRPFQHKLSNKLTESQDAGVGKVLQSICSLYCSTAGKQTELKSGFSEKETDKQCLSRPGEAKYRYDAHLPFPFRI